MPRGGSPGGFSGFGGGRSSGGFGGSGRSASGPSRPSAFSRPHSPGPVNSRPTTAFHSPKPPAPPMPPRPPRPPRLHMPPPPPRPSAFHRMPPPPPPRSPLLVREYARRNNLRLDGSHMEFRTMAEYYTAVEQLMCYAERVDDSWVLVEVPYDMVFLPNTLIQSGEELRVSYNQGVLIAEKYPFFKEGTAQMCYVYQPL